MTYYYTTIELFRLDYHIFIIMCQCSTLIKRLSETRTVLPINSEY